MNKIKEFIIKNKFKIFIVVSILIGIGVRLIGIASFPNGLNVDEVSSGYDAYSILNYGIDRNGNFLPIYLEAWGSGQSAAYAYLIIPFIKIFGLNIFAVRLPMAIISSISLIVIYKILKQTDNKKIIAIGVLFFAIMPWHIMKARWGLDCNLFPDFILYAVYFIVKFLKTKKEKELYIATIILALSSYTYATSYFFLPIFVFFLFLYLLKNKKIKIKNILISVAIMLIISLPIILYVIINTFHLKTIKIFITIPVLFMNRYEELSSIFDENFIKTSLMNFKESLMILIKQNDDLGWNALPVYGTTYIISLPFTIIGIYQTVKNKNEINSIFHIWFLVSLLLLFVIEPNINRINIIMIPIAYYTIFGILQVFESVAILKIFIPIVYLSLFVSFEISYFTTNWNEFFTFESGLENIMKYIGTVENDKIYFEYSIKEPYIYVCFYNKINTNEFVNTVKYKNNIKSFDSVESFGKYCFYIPETIDENAIYVVKSENIKKYKFKDEEFEKQNIDEFTIFKSRRK